MIEMESSLEGQELPFSEVQKQLSDLGFTVGGNWDYDHGSFDRALDDANKVWLRLPFDVTAGKLDIERDEQNTFIRFGKPFTLKHLYNEGLDRKADVMTLRGLVDQFQEPVDADAQVEPEWVEKAQPILAKAEAVLFDA